MTIDKAIEIKHQWQKDNYPPPLADEMNADMLSIEALKAVKLWRNENFTLIHTRLLGETED